MKKYILFLVPLLLIALLCSSCKTGEPVPSGPAVSPPDQQETDPPRPAETDPAVSAEPSGSPAENADANVREKVFDKKYEHEGASGQKIRGELYLSVPQITSADYPENAAKVNEYFTWLEDKYREGFENDIVELSGQEFDVEPAPLYLEVSYKTEYNRNGIISFSLAINSYSGGAHDMTVIDSATFNLRDGTRIAAGNLFTVEEDVFSRRIKEIILSMMDEQAKGEESPYYENYAELLEETFNPESFILTPDGLCIYFQIYDLAPFAGGSFRFVIPYESLADILNPQYGLITE